MSTDPESRGAAPSDRTVRAGESFEGRRTARLPGRGLEEVSQVFLQRTTDEPSIRTPKVSGGGELAGIPPTRAGAMLLRPCERVTRDQLLTSLGEYTGALEDGLRVIDANLPCDPFSEIDLLAVDRSTRLVIIDVATSQDDGLILRGVSHLEWIVRNAPNLRRMHRGLVANFSSQPRLFLVAGQFSPLFRSAVRQLADLDIACVRYHGVDISGNVGIFFERIDRDVE